MNQVEAKGHQIVLIDVKPVVSKNYTSNSDNLLKVGMFHMIEFLWVLKL